MSYFCTPRHIFLDPVNAVGMITALWARKLRNRGSIPCSGRDYCPLRRDQTGAESHKSSYSLGTGSAFCSGKAAGT